MSLVTSTRGATFVPIYAPCTVTVGRFVTAERRATDDRTFYGLYLQHIALIEKVPGAG